MRPARSRAPPVRPADRELSVRLQPYCRDEGAARVGPIAAIPDGVEEAQRHERRNRCRHRQIVSERGIRRFGPGCDPHVWGRRLPLLIRRGTGFARRDRRIAVLRRFRYSAQHHRPSTGPGWQGMTSTLPEALRNTAARFPDREAVRCQGRALTWVELWRKACGLASILQRQGVERGDRVAFYLNKSPESVIAIY